MTEFKNLNDLNSYIAFEVRDALRAAGRDATFGASNVSESCYVNVGETKLRFSCHADYVSGADRTWRTDLHAETIYVWYDAEGDGVYGTEDDLADEGVDLHEADFAHFVIDEADLARIISEAVAAA